MRRLGIVLLVAQWASPGSRLVAQRTGVLTGVVRSAASSAPVAGAEVSIDRTQLVVLTDTLGRFSVGGIPEGRHIVSVRRIGFALLSTPVHFAADDTLDAEFGLSLVATQLPKVEITARDPTTLKLTGFERRRAAGFGHFLGPEAFRNAEVRLTADVLRQLPGARLVNAANSSASWLAAGRTTRGRPLWSVDRFDRRRGATDSNCYASVYLDGMPVFSALPNELLFDVNSVPPNTIAAVEFYAGPAQAPPEYPEKRNTCGVLVLWTRL